MEGRLGANSDPEVTERYKSYQYRKLMGITEEQYLRTSCITVDWDLHFQNLENRITEARQKKG